MYQRTKLVDVSLVLLRWFYSRLIIGGDTNWNCYCSVICESVWAVIWYYYCIHQHQRSPVAVMLMWSQNTFIAVFVILHRATVYMPINPTIKTESLFNGEVVLLPYSNCTCRILKIMQFKGHDHQHFKVIYFYNSGAYARLK